MLLFENPNVILFGIAITIIILAFFVLWLTGLEYSSHSSEIKKDAKLEQKAYPSKNLPQYKSLLADSFAHIEIILRQNKNIFILTLITIFAGFTMILYGGWLLANYTGNSQDEAIRYTLINPLLIIIAGMFTESIAVVILLIYRSVSQQTEFHFKSLERLTTVGIAIQLLDDLADDKIDNEELKSTTKADIAKKLLDFYVDSSIRTGENVEKNT